MYFERIKIVVDDIGVVITYQTLRTSRKKLILFSRSPYHYVGYGFEEPLDLVVVAVLDQQL